MRHERRDVGRLAKELVRSRGVTLPRQLHPPLQVGLSPGPALLLLPRLGGQVATVEDQVRLNPMTQEQMYPVCGPGGEVGWGVGFRKIFVH